MNDFFISSYGLMISGRDFANIEVADRRVFFRQIEFSVEQTITIWAMELCLFDSHLQYTLFHCLSVVWVRDATSLLLGEMITNTIGSC